MKTIWLCLLLFGCATATPSWKWQVEQTMTKQVEIICPEDDLRIDVSKHGQFYYVNIYDQSRGNCYGPSMFVTNSVVGHKYSVIQFKPIR